MSNERSYTLSAALLKPVSFFRALCLFYAVAPSTLLKISEVFGKDTGVVTVAPFLCSQSDEVGLVTPVTKKMRDQLVLV